MLCLVCGTRWVRGRNMPENSSILKLGKAKEIAQIPWSVLISEMAGTAMLLAVGLSIVILDFGTGSPVVRWLPEPAIRRVITGFLFGLTGAAIALSPVGKHSGAHINPAVTFAFWLVGKFRTRLAVGYVLAQLTGAVLGSLPLLPWGAMGRSVAFGATEPGPGVGVLAALIGEVATTFALIIGLFVFVGHRRLRKFTPLLFPFLYAVLVCLEGPISGTSTNPARSLGPAVIAGAWRGCTGSGRW
jgi:aquaporin Z